MENFLLGKKSKAECSYTLGEQENAHNQEEMLRHNLTVNPWQGGDPARHPPQEWRVWTPHWASPLCLRDKSPKGLALKANRAHKHKSHKGKGSWEMVLKWFVHGLTYHMAQHGSSCLQSTKTFYERGLFAYHKLLTRGTSIWFNTHQGLLGFLLFGDGSQWMPSCVLSAVLQRASISQRGSFYILLALLFWYSIFFFSF